LAMALAPMISDMGGIYQFIQTVLSVFQGPMLALLLLGAFTRRPTANGGLWTLISGVLVATILLTFGFNMLYVAFAGFVYSVIALWLISGVTRVDELIDYERLTYTPWRRKRRVA